MTAEEWRPVVDVPGYEVSSLGRVASWRRGSRRLLCPWDNANGYLYVSLGKGRKRAVHVLVAEAFHGPRLEGQVVRHLDGVSQNNAATNLALGSPSENSLDAVGHGTHHSASRTHCPRDHAYTEENTRIYQGRRFCRTCKRQRDAQDRRNLRTARAAA